MIILPGIGTLAGPADTVIVQRFHYTGLEMRFLDLCGFPDAMTSTTVKDGSYKKLVAPKVYGLRLS